MMDPTTTEINERLAEFCGAKQRFVVRSVEGEITASLEVWEFPSGLRISRRQWSPCTDRNHLALVLEEAKRQGIARDISSALHDLWLQADDEEIFGIWLFTCPPEPIARAVVKVIGQQKVDSKD